MERFTVKDESGRYHLHFCKCLKGNLPSKKNLIQRLGKYEDTGLSPEEVERMEHEYFDLVVEVEKLRKELEERG